MVDGYPGDYAVMARKDRNSDAWYVGALTDEAARDVSLSLDFLEAGSYTAHIYRDGDAADWLTNPYAFERVKMTVDASDTLALTLAPGGGTAIAFVPVE